VQVTRRLLDHWTMSFFSPLTVYALHHRYVSFCIHTLEEVDLSFEEGREVVFFPYERKKRRISIGFIQPSLLFKKRSSQLFVSLSDVIISLHPVFTFSFKVVTEYLMKEYPPAYQVQYP
jgi:hypothetical protein